MPVHALLTVEDFGQLLSLLIDQPPGDVTLEDVAGNLLTADQLMAEFGTRAFKFPARQVGTGNHAELIFEIDGRVTTFKIHWAAARQGFIFWNTRIHYFIQKEFWSERERPRVCGDSLASLCKLAGIGNDLPICYPKLDDPLLCKKCLKRISEARPGISARYANDPQVEMGSV
jgi:hypothetical protein